MSAALGSGKNARGGSRIKKEEVTAKLRWDDGRREARKSGGKKKVEVKKEGKRGGLGKEAGQREDGVRPEEAGRELLHLSAGGVWMV